MRFVSDSLLERALRGVALRVLRRVERAGNADIASNGEAVFLRDMLDFYASGRAGGGIVVVDGGAHRGHYTALVLSEAQARNLTVTVHAFEPVAAAFAELEQRYGGRQDVILMNRALSSRDGRGAIHTRAEAGSLASLYDRDLRAAGLSLDGTEPVQLMRLDSYIAAAGIGKLHLLKLDVEGSEHDVLLGLGRYLHPEFVDFIQFEYGGANLDARVPLKAFFDLFERAGFVVAKVFPQGLKVRPYGTWMDNFDYANFVAIARPLHEQLVN